jgi:hypothetical protein
MVAGGVLAKATREGTMNVYTIVLERIGSGEPSLSIVTRQDNEEAARAYAEAASAITGPAGHGDSCPTL